MRSSADLFDLRSRLPPFGPVFLHTLRYGLPLGSGHRPHALACLLQRVADSTALLRDREFRKRSFDGNNFRTKLLQHCLRTTAGQVAKPIGGQSSCSSWHLPLLLTKNGLRRNCLQLLQMVNVVSGHLRHDPADRQLTIFRMRERTIDLLLRQALPHRKIQAA